MFNFEKSSFSSFESKALYERNKKVSSGVPAFFVNKEEKEDKKVNSFRDAINLYSKRFIFN